MFSSLSKSLIFLAVISCGGKALPPDGTGDDAGPFGRGDGASGDGNTYVDPKCPDAGQPQQDIECDVFAQQCPAGEACYPFEIPPKKACESEIYGSACLEVGGGTQGAACDNTVGCAAGFVCLITGASTSCAKMCEFGSTTHGCSDGFVCEPIDIPGFAACL